jgi:ABC-type nickel/cobalt efflux system permease component RcnA
MRTRDVGLGFSLIAALIAAGLGALHALEPGHGKTIVAAYLVGSRGTARHAFLLGLIVTASHSAGVYLLGAITLYAQKYVLPEQTYPLLAVLSGLFVAGMGLYLFLQRSVPGALPYSHSHGLGEHGHSHGGLWHSHVHAAGHTQGEPRPAANARTISGAQLLLLGVTGGVVPCPAALVVLLSAAATHRIGFGLFLIACFSVGLASVLIGMGIVAIYAGRWMAGLPTDGPLIQRWLPMSSAAMITVIGCVMAVRGLLATGVLQGRI